ncbi:MAG TPA: SDR family NAD(P)-dependent oxidoreductase [Chloroflexota bacterium]|jgi:3-oxoacyl-[acyl-carrier protein] reductase
MSVESAAPLAGKVALITGVGQNIGRATARALAARGALVALNDLDGAKAARVVEELPSAARARALPGDVRDRSAVQALVEAVLAAYGRIDVLVNNAGRTSIAPLLEMTEADWDLELDSSLKGTFLASQAAARAMVARGGGGRIICLASTAAESARVGGASHCAAKAGIAMLVKVMALELGRHGITVNAVAPGLVPSPAEVTSPAYRDAYRQMVPLGRLGEPEDIAGAIAFLASDAAAWINGAILPVDGGFLAGRPLPLSSEQGR